MDTNANIQFKYGSSNVSVSKQGHDNRPFVLLLSYLIMEINKISVEFLAMQYHLVIFTGSYI